MCLTWTSTLVDVTSTMCAHVHANQQMIYLSQLLSSSWLSYRRCDRHTKESLGCSQIAHKFFSGRALLQQLPLEGACVDVKGNVQRVIQTSKLGEIKRVVDVFITHVIKERSCCLFTFVHPWKLCNRGEQDMKQCTKIVAVLNSSKSNGTLHFWCAWWS